MAQIEFDEGSGTFPFFVVLLYGLFLIVLTYFLWPRSKKAEDRGRVCQCAPCCQKRNKVEKRRTLDKLLKFLRVIVLIVCWGLLIWLVYWAVTQEPTSATEEWDPYVILGLDKSATASEIKKRYRSLSMTHHPDKGGDPEVFTKIAKAYEALTHEEARENWEKYGNPDGPRAASFGVALPSWIVDENNSLWVLGGYVMVFIVGLPIIVGTWWYRSVKYGTTNILIHTSKLYFHLLSKAKTMPMLRVIMILSTAVEFNQNSQAGVKNRPSDDIYLNQLVKQLEHSIRVDTKEPPFCQTYVAKTRLLMHSYFERITLQDPGLKQDQDAIVKYSPFLINEMMNILTQVWVYSKYMGKPKGGGRKIPEPSLDMYENIMMISQIMVQAMWRPFEPLEQLPHITDRKYFYHKKHRISNVEDFAKLKPEERRRLLKNLSDEEYHDIMIFCDKFPHIEMTVDTEVPDDEDAKTISAGSYVTIKVNLIRKGLLEYYGTSAEKEISPQDEDNEEEMENEKMAAETLTFENSPSPTQGAAHAVKAKQQKGKKKGKPNKGGGGGGKKKKQVQPKKQENQKDTAVNKRKQEGQQSKKGKVSCHTHPTTPTENESGDESDQAEDDGQSLDDEEREWRELQKSVKKERDQQKNQQNNTGHLVHAPFFPADKHELWWVYVAQKKTKTIIIPPERVTGLMDNKEVNLKTVMERKGLFKYTVFATSDSYLGYTVEQDIVIKVHEKKEVSGKEQWVDLEKEEEEEDMIEESVTESESDEDSDD